MPRFAAKKDLSHAPIADGLRKDGWSVMDLSHAGRGIPDILVSKGWVVCPIEIKSEGKPMILTEAERRVYSAWKGPYIITASLEDALAQLAALEGAYER